MKRKSTTPNWECENTYNNLLSRVRAHTHYRSFCVFAVTSVTGLYTMRYVSSYCGVLGIYFNKCGFQRLKMHREHDQKSILSLFRPPPEIGQFFIKIPPLCDTCDSKKSTSLLEGARVHACVKQETRRSRFLSSTLRKIRMQKNVLSLFPWFFTLWSYIDPYPYRDWLDICCSYVIRQKQRKQ